MLVKNIVQSLVSSSLIAKSMAQPVAHLHHQHEKRDVVVVTETVVVTMGGAAAPTAATVNLVHAETTPSVAAGATTAPAQVVPTTTSSIPQVAATTTSAAATTAATSTGSSSSSSFNGGAKGVTYSPYTSSGQCKSLSEVQSDFAKLSGFEIIRLYGSDCDQVANVLQAKGKNQKLFIGIFYVDAIESAVSTIASAVKSYGSWNDVYTISVGNELVNAGSASVAQIGSYVSTARASLTAAGYTGPVVSVDTHVAIINNPGLCEYSDYIAFNAHAYWDGTIYPQDAGSWLLLQMQRVWNACGGKKDVLCVESGWPHQGDTYGVAVASPDAQQSAISSLKASVGNSVVLFTAYDDLWKNPGPQNCEQYWGFL